MMTEKKGLSPTKLGSQIEEEILLGRQCLKIKPDSHAFLPLAKAYCQAGRYAEALETCRQGLGKHPDYWAAQVVLGQAYIGQGMLDEALAQLELVTREVPNNLLASKLLGHIYITQGRLDEAIQRYSTILNYHPECAELAEALHRLELEKKRRYEETVRELEGWLGQIRDYQQLKAA